MYELLATIFLLAFIVLVVGLFNPAIIKMKSRKNVALSLVGVVLLFIAIGATNQKKPVESKPVPVSVATTTAKIDTATSTEEKLTELFKETLPANKKTGPLTNYYYLVITKDESEANLTRIAKDFKAANCTVVKCNLMMYNDKVAYELEKEFFTKVDGTQEAAWLKKNKPFMAKHALGTLYFDNDKLDFTPWK